MEKAADFDVTLVSRRNPNNFRNYRTLHMRVILVRITQMPQIRRIDWEKSMPNSEFN